MKLSSDESAPEMMKGASDVLVTEYPLFCAATERPDTARAITTAVYEVRIVLKLLLNEDGLGGVLSADDQSRQR